MPQKSYSFLTSMPAIAAMLVAFLPVSAHAATTPGKKTRDMAECSIRSTIIELSLSAYTNRDSVSALRSEDGAVNYIAQQTRNQNLKQREGLIVIRRAVKYVYEDLHPSTISRLGIKQVGDDYYRNCMFDPQKQIGNFYIIDLKKASSKNTDGYLIIHSGQPNEMICHAGQCVSHAERGSYDPIPKGWNIKIDLPGVLGPGVQYCTERGQCATVSGNNKTSYNRTALRSYCRHTPNATACMKAGIPVRLLAASPANTIIVRLAGKNYAVGNYGNGVFVNDHGSMIPYNMYSRSTH